MACKSRRHADHLWRSCSGFDATSMSLSTHSNDAHAPTPTAALGDSRAAKSCCLLQSQSLEVAALLLPWQRARRKKARTKAGSKMGVTRGGP